jgi:hypothetical protein
VEHMPAASHEEGRRTQADRALMHSSPQHSARSPHGLGPCSPIAGLVKSDVRIHSEILQALRVLLGFAAAVGTKETQSNEQQRSRACSDGDRRYGACFWGISHHAFSSIEGVGRRAS